MSRRKTPVEERFWRFVTVKDGCWDWNGAIHTAGYGLLGKGGRHEGLIRASHVSWKIHHGEYPPEDKLVCHKCDNPRCTNPTHLFLGTYLDNSHDCLNKGRMKLPAPRFGLDNYKGKLSNDDVIAIREMWLNAPKRRFGREQYRTQLAAHFGVSHSTIKDVVAKRKVHLNVG